jgi:hypothetical protein
MINNAIKVGFDFNSIEPTFGYSPLTIAVLKNCSKVLRYLLGYEPNTKIKDDKPKPAKSRLPLAKKRFTKRKGKESK